MLRPPKVHALDALDPDACRGVVRGSADVHGVPRSRFALYGVAG